MQITNAVRLLAVLCYDLLCGAVLCALETVYIQSFTRLVAYYRSVCHWNISIAGGSAGAADAKVNVKRNAATATPTAMASTKPLDAIGLFMNANKNKNNNNKLNDLL